MNWGPWLRLWSEEWVRSADPQDLVPEVVRDKWLGFEPADEAAVVAAEDRLGVRLPPSYREFLLTTDGWRNAGMFVWRLRDTSNLGWLRDIEPFWAGDWEGLEGEPEPDDDNKFTRGLMISLEADAGVLFLDPGDVDEAGEWAAYSLFTWRAEAPSRFASFTALMQDLYAEFHQMLKPPGTTRDSWDAKVEQARLDALAGDVDGAGAVLAQAEEFGRIRATVLRAQLELVLGNDYQAGMLFSRLLRPGFMPEGFLTDPLFTDELLPWLFVEQERSPGYRSSILQSALIGDRPEIREAIDAGQIRRDHTEPNYGNPEFDMLVKRALGEHADDPEALWHAVIEAMPRWRPRTVDHIAPVALLVSPVLAAIWTRDRGRELLSIPI
ncbi:SMI1/KNR4 family protein [Actinosynnema sp. ALI-1.44]|uniref:SMI1/KNR4 family protein n=1 Tax=Actinosynnema sp. ALI-1.44 TaxID=1933779 RepID=UPI00143D3290|nr:SMI1/KNR4 family protein [Actinosynnema sp. ALI-1.44]